MSSASTSPQPLSVDSEAKLIPNSSNDEEPFVPQTVQPCNWSQALVNSQGRSLDEKLETLDKNIQRLLERTDEVHDMVAGLVIPHMTGMGTIGWAPSFCNPSIGLQFGPAPPSVNTPPPQGPYQQLQQQHQQHQQAVQGLPANRLASSSASDTTAHWSNGIRELAHLQCQGYASYSSQRAEVSQETFSTSMELDGVDTAGRAQHESHRKLCQRVQARLGLRHRYEAVTRDCLHTALVTLGIEQYGLSDVEYFVLELQEHAPSYADEGDKIAEQKQRRKKRRSDQTGSMDADSSGIDFGFFMEVMANTLCSDASMPLTSKSRELLLL